MEVLALEFVIMLPLAGVEDDVVLSVLGVELAGGDVMGTDVMLRLEVGDEVKLLEVELTLMTGGRLMGTAPLRVLEEVVELEGGEMIGTGVLLVLEAREDDVVLLETGVATGDDDELLGPTVSVSLMMREHAEQVVTDLFAAVRGSCLHCQLSGTR